MQEYIKRRANEEGYMLAVLMFAVAMVMISLALAAPRLARSIQRDRELETVHRADQYVRAIQLYYRKFGRYPSSIDQLVNTNNVRFLRQKYVDPMTGKDNWKLIHLGQNKTQSTGFFGKPLSGVGTAGGGFSSTASLGSNTQSSFSSSGFGASNNNLNNTNSSTGAPGASGIGLGGGTTDSSGSSVSTGGGISSQSATSFSGGVGGPIIGVSSVATGESLMLIHEKNHYNEWEFFYDPRIDQMKAAAVVTGGPGGVGSNTVSNFGGTGFSINGANGSNPTFGPGSTFGSGGSSGPSGGPVAPIQPQQTQ